MRLRIVTVALVTANSCESIRQNTIHGRPARLCDVNMSIQDRRILISVLRWTVETPKSYLPTPDWLQQEFETERPARLFEHQYSTNSKTNIVGAGETGSPELVTKFVLPFHEGTTYSWGIVVGGQTGECNNA
eukprot:scaffold4007_cov111-Cylindrotheca_fusiformis.AAC.1